MRLEWIEDVLAVAETGSFQAAAERRRLTQPAFSRRLRAIETSLGATLFDRSTKPARLLPHALDEIERMRALSAGLRDLAAAFRVQGRSQRNRLVLAAQHAISITAAPALIETLADLDLDIRLRSANRHESLALVMTREADIALVHDVREADPLPGAEFLTVAAIGTERLIPVIAATALAALNQAYEIGEVPLIAYPEEVFLGEVQQRRLFPAMRHAGRMRKRLETALTLAALQCARSGVGVAWVPETLAKEDLDRGTLVDLSRTLPWIDLILLAVRLNGAGSAAMRRVWDRLAPP